MKHIRTPGVAVFFVLVLFIVVFWWLLAGMLVERAVEDVGTRLVGARVDLDSADIGIFPLSLELNGLAVTNPDEPMTNAVEIARIAAAIDVGPLFRRKVHIDTLLVQGVDLGTARESSGALDPDRHSDSDSETEAARDEAAGASTKEESWASSFEMPSFDTPNIDEILANEDLESLRIIGDARKAADDAMSSWKQRLDELPDEDRLEDYKKRVNSLGKGGIAGAIGSVGEIAALRTDVERDIKALESATKEIKGETLRIQELATQAARAPARDLDRLQEKYGLSQQGAGNLSRRLLGPKVAEIIDKALAWRARIEPLLARAEGGDESDEGGPKAVTPLRGKGLIVRFREDEPTPDFLIRLADVHILLDAGTFSGTIRDITPDQPVHGKPLSFEFAGEDMEGLDRLHLTGTVDRRNPGSMRDVVLFQLDGLQLEEVALSDTDPWQIELTRGALDFELDAEREQEKIAAQIRMKIREATLTPQFSGSGAVARSIAGTLTEVDELEVTAELRGTFDDYELEVRSDVDSLFRKAVSRLAAQQTSRLRSQLSKGITQRTDGPLSSLQGDVSGLGGLESEIAKRTDLAEDIFTGGDDGKSDDGKKKKKKKRKLPGGIKLPF